MTSGNHRKDKKTALAPRRRVSTSGRNSVARKGGNDSTVDGSLVAFDFCGISMLVRRPTLAQRRLRIAEGQAALAKLPKILAKPGVKLALSKTHPIYVADKREPSLVVQTIGNVSRRGRFDKNGRFVVVK